MQNIHTIEGFEELSQSLEGELLCDKSTLLQYATDASAYREIPLAVALPKGKNDLVILVKYAKEKGIPLIPRAAGTSLAGQVVGKAIIVDISRYWGKILEINDIEGWVRVEPGVILDELNRFLKPYGLFFGPETSTSNRCMIAGMVGNNSCGAHSIIYGSTRDHTISLKMILDDGLEYEFGNLTKYQFTEKQKLSNREGDLYRQIFGLLSNSENQEEIANQYPDSIIKRRNTGYALDLLLDCDIFRGNDKPFNFCKLIAGSEGTLGIITEIKLNLVPLPPPEKAVVCVHLEKREEAFKANLIALKYKPGAVELMDHLILDCTKGNIEQQKNRYFVQGDPGAILIVEFAKNTQEEISSLAQSMEEEMRRLGLGYHFPVIRGNDIAKVWALRKAGLGVLSNIEGDAKPVSLVEDTAVAVEKLPDYMEEFASIVSKYNLDCVYHAHIGSGELHLRPVLNLKNPNEVEIFRNIAIDVAHLVKKYRGSLSGEHGDGRLRSELIPIVLGDKVYQMLTEVKKSWDPSGIFNPGKIVDSPKLNTSLRYEPGAPTREIATIFSFQKEGGILRAVEKCNGSGDCRKTYAAGGTMCPSYMATQNERNSTRARANILREFLTHSRNDNPFNHKEIYDVLDLCLSCKGCKSECPSSIDMAKFKSEFLFHWYKEHGTPLRNWMVANITRINSIGSIAPRITNFFLSNAITRSLIMRVLGFSIHRQLPLLETTSLKTWFRKKRKKDQFKKQVFLLADEFTNYNDTKIGIKAIELLEALGYEISIAPVFESGRTYISKGLLNTARRIACKNVKILSGIVTQEQPLIGIEPSAILSFRDEYPELVTEDLREKAIGLSKNCFLFEEFFTHEVELNNINSNQFVELNKTILLHGHCQQKAVASTLPTLSMLNFPKGFTVKEIPSGCCGMAGSFGYEKEHYDLSMQVGELVLFPEIRKAINETVITAPGTSCRHHIKDGTGRLALHPIEIMHEALKR